MGVEILCLQTAYKKSAKVDLLVVDEIHRSLSPIYRKLYSNIQYSSLLGLTATKPHKQEYLELLEEIAPVCFSANIEDAINAGAVANYSIYNLEITMDKSSRAKYRTFDGMLKRAQLEISLLKRRIPELKDISIFDVAQKYSKLKEGELSKWSKEFWNAMSMRKWTCYNNQNKLNVAKQIIDAYPNRKWILFNKSIKFAEQLASIIPESGIYHSQQTKVERDSILEDFRTNKIRRLIAVDALNEGLNVPDADSAICLSGVSTELTQNQTLGRVSRKSEDNKIALFINLYSKDTIEETWVRKKTGNLKVK